MMRRSLSSLMVGGMVLGLASLAGAQVITSPYPGGPAGFSSPGYAGYPRYFASPGSWPYYVSTPTFPSVYFGAPPLRSTYVTGYSGATPLINSYDPGYFGPVATPVMSSYSPGYSGYTPVSSYYASGFSGLSAFGAANPEYQGTSSDLSPTIPAGFGSGYVGTSGSFGGNP